MDVIQDDVGFEDFLSYLSTTFIIIRVQKDNIFFIIKHNYLDKTGAWCVFIQTEK